MLALLLSLAGSAPGEGVVWVGVDAPVAFVARLEGQLSDLPWAPRRSAAVRPVPSGRNVAAALEAVGPDFRVRVWAAEGELARRELTGLGRGFPAFEAAAVVVRSVVAVREPDSGPLEAASASALTRTSTPSALWARLGVRAETWGLAPATAGAEAALGWRREQFGFGVGVAGSWPQTVEDARTRRTYARLAPFLTARWWPSGRGAAFVDARAGAAFWSRRTEALVPNVVPRPDGWTVGGFGGVSGGWRFGLGAGWALEASVGVDLFVGHPRFVLAGADEDGDEPWWGQPWLAVAMSWSDFSEDP